MSKNRLEMPSVLITGANGWLGRSAISVLTERYPNKFRIYALTRNKNNLSNLHLQNVQVINYDEVQHIDSPIIGLIHKLSDQIEALETCIKQNLRTYQIKYNTETFQIDIQFIKDTIKYCTKKNALLLKQNK